ncbi:MAG: MFS transporter [Alphaproteobacteria bacterium]|nr:MFS transporter [Alphaproteobacteria bacterium]
MNTKPEDAETPKSFAALRHPGARVYLIGSCLAMMGDSIEHVISYWIMWEKFQSPELGGFAIISHWLPFLLFSFWAGALADRFDPRRIIQIGMALFMVASLGWGYFFVTDSLEKWHAVILLIIHGIAGVLWNPAAQLFVHDMVGGQQLQSAIRMMSSARMLGFLMGPAIGGGLMLAFGPAMGIFINVLIYVPLALWLWKAPYGPKFRKEEDAPPKRQRPVNSFADVVAAVKEISTVPVVFSMTMLAGVAAMIVGNAHQAQMPEFAYDFGFSDTSIRYSFLLAAAATGAFTAGVVLESKSLLPAKVNTAFVLALIWCLAIGGFAVTTNFYLAVGLLFFAGFVDLAFNAMTRTLAQLHAPLELRGRAIGLYNVGSLGMRTFSGLTVGVGGGYIGIHWSLGISVVVLFVAILALFAYCTRNSEKPDAA